MTGAHVWTGRRGPVVLGPTQHRMALWMDAATRRGQVTLRMSAVAAALGLERSEAYRIARRLRVLGLFGVANDPSGHGGGRRWWRTPTPHDGQELDPVRHHVAWARMIGWARRRGALATDRLRALRQRVAGLDTPRPSPGADDGPLPSTPPAPGRTFAELMRAAGLGPLMDEWKVPR